MIILSPSKGQNFGTPLSCPEYTTPEFLNQSQILINTLQKYDIAGLRTLMSISDKIATLNQKRFQTFSTPFTPNNAKQAVFAFKGDVYQGLETDSFSEDNLQFAQQQLRILSGLYGCLRPLDLIQPYRLEMKTKLINPRGKDLYTFWGNRVTESLNRSATAAHSKFIINLASNEYSRVIRKNTLTVPLIDIVFKELKNDNLRTIAVYAKRARGMMSSFIIRNHITTPDDIKSFTAGMYAFDDTLSTEQKWVFTRPQP